MANSSLGFSINTTNGILQVRAQGLPTQADLSELNDGQLYIDSSGFVRVKGRN